MSEPFTPLTELERDALAELSNIAMAKAANSLRKMVQHEVLLAVPSVDILSNAAAANLVGKPDNPKLVAVRQDFAGPFSGRALLIFPETNSLELVRAGVGQQLALEDIVDLEDEALAETGNVILNGCLSTIANMLHHSMEMSLPEVVRGDGERLFESAQQPADGVVLFLYINFSISDRDIRGYIAVLMDLPSLTALSRLVNNFIDRVLGEQPVHPAGAVA